MDTSAQQQDTRYQRLMVGRRWLVRLSHLTVASALLNSDYAVAKGNQ